MVEDDVGLYEFIWLQRPRFPDTDDQVRFTYAEEALRIVLARGNRRLVWKVWPDFEPVGEVALEGLDDTKWDVQPDGRYVSVAAD
ncbi:MAG TPA: hypothetical protein VI138_00550 [Candidatus Dormibacteraeota bacterium]